MGKKTVEYFVDRITPYIPRWTMCDKLKNKRKLTSEVRKLRKDYSDCLFRGRKVISEVIE